MKKMEWDSKFWGLSIYELDDLDSPEGGKLDYSDCNDGVLIQSKIDLKNSRRINELERAGFSFQDLEITYEKNLEKSEDCYPLTVKKTNPEAVENIARESITYSRYNIFPRELVAEYYGLWARNAVLGVFDDECLVLDDDINIRGFVSYKVNSISEARVGLICVNKRYQGKGIGTHLLKGLEEKLYVSNGRNLQITTQGSNIPANNFYIHNRYRIKDIKSIYYYRSKGNLK